MSTIKNNLIKTIKKNLNWSMDIVHVDDKHRWSIKLLSDYIIKHRKEIGLYKKSDFEINVDKAEEAAKNYLYRNYGDWEDTRLGQGDWSINGLAKAIANKNPIKIKGEKK